MRRDSDDKRSGWTSSVEGKGPHVPLAGRNRRWAAPCGGQRRDRAGAAGHNVRAVCGRYTLTRPGALLEADFGLTELPSGLSARFNIAPSQDVAAITDAEPGRLSLLRWGLIPSWAKDPKIGSRLINARGETLSSKPSFRSAYRKRRCLVLADGFYEWQVTGAGKVPIYIRRRDLRPFAFAGLWDRWQAEASPVEVRTCTIVTTEPNALLAPIHDRMPVILGREGRAAWLHAASGEPLLQSLLVPCAAEELEAYPVSRAVNAPAVARPELVLPVEAS